MSNHPDSNEKRAESVPLKEIAVEKVGALQPEDTVKTAGDRMRSLDVETWPVSEDQKLVGMVGEKNPDWAIGGQGHDPKDYKVSKIMSREIVFCYEDEDCIAAKAKMDEHGLSYLPVVDRDMRIVGIFSKAEIATKAEECSGTNAISKEQAPES